MPQILSQVREEIEQRLAELDEAVKEAEQLRQILQAMEHQATNTIPTRLTQPALPSPSQFRRHHRSRRMPAEQRKQELLDLVRRKPMITAADLANQLGLSQPRISQLTSSLGAEGRLIRSGNGFMVIQSISAAPTTTVSVTTTAPTANELVTL